MKKSKRWIAIFCITLLISTFSFPAFAKYDDDFKTSRFGETLSKSQEVYMAEMEKVITENSSDEQQIETICETFLTLAKASVREPQKYDCSQLIATDSLKKNTVQYRLTDYQYKSALYKALGWKITKDELVFTNFKLHEKQKITL